MKVRHIFVFLPVFISLLFLSAQLPIPFFYSSSHPNYEHYQEKIINLRAGVNDTIDFTALNSGKWTMACLFGGYTNPLAYMQNYGRVTMPDRIFQSYKGWSLVQFGQVAEHETMIAYVDNLGVVTFINFAKSPMHGSIENEKLCTKRADPVLQVRVF